jgi:Galactose oxidase, central domain
VKAVHNLLLLFFSLILMTQPVLGLGHWTEINVAGPGIVKQHEMTYDRHNQFIVMYGGYDGGAPTSNLFSYNGFAWSPIAATGSPPGRLDGGFSYVRIIVPPFPDIHGYLLFGGEDFSKGYLGDSWVFDPDYIPATWFDLSATWSCTVTPSARTGHTIVWDPGDISGTPKAIMYGGKNGPGSYLDDVWFFDPALINTCPWTGPYQPAIRPLGRAYHAMCFDESRGVVVIFGGDGASAPVYYETWEYNPATNQWTEKTCATHPDDLEMMSMSYDTQHSQVVLYGGKDPNVRSGEGRAYEVHDETWEYDPYLPDWIEVTSVDPPARFHAAMAYAQNRDAHVLYGGENANNQLLNDTWEYKYYSTPTPTPTSPPVPSTGTTGKMSILLVFTLIFLLLGIQKTRITESH